MKYKMLTMLILCCFMLLDAALAVKENVYFAPAKQGAGSGKSPQDAAFYADKDIWNSINELLKETEVVAWLIDGAYDSEQLVLTTIGNDNNRLTISGVSSDGAVMCADIGTMFDLHGCRNITIENVNFTGPIKGYALKITKNDKGLVSENILINKCNWYDLEELYYGCLGVHHGSNRVKVTNSTFKRMGVDPHSHFIYNAHSVNYLSVIDNHFEDCSGSFVRFRDNCRFIRVSGNTFISTGDYVNFIPTNYHEVFIDIPHFNDVNPGDEQFGSHYIITNNIFKFSPKPEIDRFFRTGIRFSHSGYDFPGYNYIMNFEQGKILEGKDSVKKMQLLLNNCGLDFNTVLVRDNIWHGEQWKLQFTSKAQFGAESKGWDKEIDVSDILDFAGSCITVDDFKLVN